MNIIDNDLLSIQQARILAENAYEAQKKMTDFSQERLDKIVRFVADEIGRYAEELARLSQEETDYGKQKDKYFKNKFVCNHLKRRLAEMRCVGIISEDREKQVMDVGVPLGVVAALCPATSPVSTAIFKTLIAIKSGNAIVFSPHPRARQTSFKAIEIMMEVAGKHDLPEGAISYLHTLSPSGTVELMRHKNTAIVLNTGVPEMLDAALSSGKPVIYGGSGNGPAFIERTADIRQAVSDIILSKTFDNGIVSAAEHSVVVDAPVADEVKKEMTKQGAYFMSDRESEALGKMFFQSDGTLNTELIGISAGCIAKRAGFSVPEDVKVLVSEQKYVFQENPYSKEKLCPVLAYYVEQDWRSACEKCIELLIGERQGHTLVIHSKDDDVIRQYILRKPVARVLVNTPAVFGSMGVTTNLFPSMTLGSGSWGSGITSDNVSPMNLVYIRKVGYGVTKADVNIENLYQM
ncbi:MAG: aldehyde dehydrogenase family protein [Defluviitaleaceae bacterium]|nr:aldehyde dehydrogenase family protein [Defluviitaleaceae bacterium]